MTKVLSTRVSVLIMEQHIISWENIIRQPHNNRTFKSRIINRVTPYTGILPDVKKIDLSFFIKKKSI